MNNVKQIGTSFEREIANILSEHGYYVHTLKGSQTFDLLAGRKNQIYGFECKTCDKGKFNISRIEVNQLYGFKTFKDCGNVNAYFVFKYNNTSYIVEADYILSVPYGQVQVDKLQTLGEWLSANSSK